MAVAGLGVEEWGNVRDVPAKLIVDANYFTVVYLKQRNSKKGTR